MVERSVDLAGSAVDDAELAVSRREVLNGTCREHFECLFGVFFGA